MSRPASNEPSGGSGDASRSEVAYTALRDQIVEGALRPGSRLVERDLAATLGVSRIPVREALRQLAAEGLVEVLPRRGTLVSPITAQGIRELFDVRESLESLAARLVARRVSTSGPVVIERLHRQLDLAFAATFRAQGSPGSSRRLTNIAAANADFHAELIELSGNTLLRSIMLPLHSQMRRLFRFTAERDPVELYREHEELFGAIEHGDEDRVEELAREHVMCGLQPTLELLAASDTLDDDGRSVAPGC